ncbi:hypothetical protein HD599_002961 [Conyzicola lurida]|uniref:Bacterial Ig-like domain-containing protein n=1 Tax=Conyzicola lurida TaxID=1172621 RepID=A0A841AQR7_9MICO|nr:Ig-like domain-containing protein [Conyzicola lurida]MBB5844638.1 hypothetical protein [Conyzicola lurida]
MFTRAVTDTLRFYKTGWWRLALLQLATGVALAASVLVITGVASLVIGTDVFALSAENTGPIAAVIFAVIGLTLIVGLPISLAGLAASVRLVDDILAGTKPRAIRAFFHSYSRSWSLVRSTLLLVVGTLLLIVLSPLLSVLGIVGLVLTVGVALVRRRRAGFLDRWPTVRQLVWAAVPFAFAARWLTEGLFFIPAATLSDIGPVTALREGAPLMRGRVVAMIGVLAGTFALGLLLQVALTSLGSLLGGGGAANTGTLVAQVLAQSVLVALPVVVLTVLFRLAQATPAGATPPTSRTAPYATGDAWVAKKPFRPVLAPAAIRRVALLMPAVLLIGFFVMPVGAAQAVPAAAQLQFVVNSAVDTVDEVALADQQANCVSAAADCTLRAALAEARVAALSGTYSTISIVFAGDYTIPVTANRPLMFDLQGGEGPSTAGTVTISGANHKIVLDGQNTGEVMAFYGRGWGLYLNSVQISNGLTGVNQAGGGLSVATTATSVVDSVTFDHNTATGAGGAIINNGRLSVVNSTFSSNTVGATQDFVPGGADIYNYGTSLTVNNSTFYDSRGTSSIFNFGINGYVTTLNNSLFAGGNAGVAACGYNSSSNEITGKNNVVSGGDTTCPGTVPNTGPSVRPLASVSAVAPQVHSLIASNPGAPVNAAIGAGGQGTGAVACAPVDQRGAARLAVGCSVGAVEFGNGTTTILTSSDLSETYGNAVIFTAVVTQTDGGAPVASGAVQFSIDGATAGPPVTLGSDGIARYSTSGLSVGTHAVTAAFLTSDAQTYAVSTSAPLSQVIEESAVAVEISSSGTPAALDSTVTFRVRVSVRGTELAPTGTVTLTDVTGGGSTVIAADVPLVGEYAASAASIPTSTLPAGRRTIVADYSGDGADLAPTRSAPFAQVVQAPSTVETSISDVDVAFGVPVSVTFTVPTTYAGIVPTGSFYISYDGLAGSTVLQPALDAAGSATVTIRDLASTTTAIYADYRADDVYASSRATDIPVTVRAAAVATTLGISPTGSTAYGTPITLSGTVATTAPGSEKSPTGTVDFTVGGVSIGSAPLVQNGEIRAVATLVTTAGQLPVGSNTVVAEFVPATAGQFVPTASTAGTVVVTKADPAIALTSGANPAVTGQSVALNAAVTGPAGTTGIPDGVVTFRNGDTVLGTATLSNGIATLAVATLPLGSSRITAAYAGSASYTAVDSSALAQRVAAASVDTQLVITPGSTSTYGTRLRLDGTAAVVSPGGGVPTGRIVVKEGTVVVATIELDGGTGSKTIFSPGAGSHEYVATFEPGTDAYLTSSTTVTYSVGAATTTTDLVLSAQNTVYGVPVTMTATVANASGGSTPEGTVTFFGSGSIVGTAEVDANGVATFTGGLPSGVGSPFNRVNVVARFEATANFNSSSDLEQIYVQQGKALVTVGVGESTSDKPTVVTATVSTVTGYGETPGYVRFTSRGENLGSAVVVDGVAVLKSKTFAVGRNYVDATYVGSNPHLTAADLAGQPFDTTPGAPVPVLTGSQPDPVGYGTPETVVVEIPTTGVAPTGTITVTATGAAGTRELATVPVTSYRTLIEIVVPAGEQSVTARYNGDFNYVAETSNALARNVTGATTTTMVGIGGAVYIGRSVAVQGRVRNETTSAPPTGTMTFMVGTEVIGTAPVGTNGVASVAYTPKAQGAVDVTAIYNPTSATDFLPSRAVQGAYVQGLPLTISLAPAAYQGEVAVGVPYRYTATVLFGPGVAASSPDPTGTVTFTDSYNGLVCEAELGRVPGGAEARCALTFPVDASTDLTATYEGDALYGAVTSERLRVEPSTRTPTVEFAASKRWIAGEPVTLTWAVYGPDAGSTVVISRGGTEVCRSTALKGSCSYTFEQHALNGEFTLNYEGNVNWKSQSRTVAQSVTSCVPAKVAASPAAGGSVILFTAPTCNKGTGFLVGQEIIVFATPNADYDFVGWADSEETGTSRTILVTEYGTVDETAFFARQCVTVVVNVGVAAELRATSTAFVDVSPEPNCGTGWKYSNPTTNTPTYYPETKTARYLPDTVLSLTARPPSVRASAPSQSLYNWNGLGALADPLALTQSYTVVRNTGFDDDNEIGAVFGVTCYHGISFAPPAKGTAQLSANTCWDAAGAGFADKSTVTATTKPIGDAYFERWSYPVTPVAAATNAKVSVGTVVVSPESNRPITATYNECISFSATATGFNEVFVNNSYFHKYYYGTVEVSSPGNCPNKGAGWYVPGTTVNIVTAVDVNTGAFGGFTGDYADRLDPASKRNTITLDRSGTLSANFYSKNGCVPVGLTARPAGAVTASVVTPGNGCPAGMLSYKYGEGGGETITLTATATGGDPLLGWSGSTRRQVDRAGTTVEAAIKGVAQNSLTVNAYGKTSYTAWACQSLTPSVTLISPNGTKHTTTVNVGSQFVGASAAPDCPIATNAYTVDQPVFLRAPGESSGYSFIEWSNGLGTSIAPKTPIVLDGSAKYSAVTATYQVHCFTLRTNLDVLDVDVEPNCPDTPASEQKYVGGTSVTFTATGAGNKNFRGFTGAPDGQEGNYAWVTIDGDTAVYANYESKSIGQVIVDGITSVANNIAVGAKKAVGVAAAVAGAFLVGDNPVMLAANLVVLLGQAVQAIADRFGLSSEGLASFTNGIKALSQTLDMISATTTCTTAWALASNAAAAPTVSSTAATKIGSVATDKINAAQKAVDAKRQAEIYEQMVTVNMFKDAKAATVVTDTGQGAASSTSKILASIKAKGAAAADSAQEVADKLKGPLGYAAAAGDVAMIGYKLYADIDSGAAGWDPDAATAWTQGADLFMNCMTNSIPDYMGVPKTT